MRISIPSFQLPRIFPLFFLSVFIRVNPWFQISSAKKNRGERLTPGCGAGMETLGRVNDGATGGMSADILLAHYIAAAKVRSNLYAKFL